MRFLFNSFGKYLPTRTEKFPKFQTIYQKEIRPVAPGSCYFDEYYIISYYSYVSSPYIKQSYKQLKSRLILSQSISWANKDVFKNKFFFWNFKLI